MSTDTTQGTSPAPTTGAADTAPVDTRPADAAVEQVEFKSVVAARDALKAEIKALRAEVAGMRTQPQTKPEPMSKVDGDSLALAELAFRDALDDIDVRLDKGQKNLLRRLYRAEKPSDPGAWLSDAVGSLSLASRAPAAPAAPAVERPPQTVPITNTGAPSGGVPIGQLPANLRDIPHDILKAMPAEEFARRKAAWDAENSPNRNPWAKPKPA